MGKLKGAITREHGRTDKIHALQIEVGSSLGQRPERIAHVRKSAEQALLFRARPEKNLRATGRMRNGCLRHRQQCCRTAGIVDFAHSQMIPVCRIDHRLLFQYRVGPRHDAGDIELINLPPATIDDRMRNCRELDRFEAAHFSLSP